MRTANFLLKSINLQECNKLSNTARSLIICNQIKQIGIYLICEQNWEEKQVGEEEAREVSGSSHLVTEQSELVNHEFPDLPIAFENHNCFLPC